MEKGEGLVKEDKCMTHGHRQQCGDGLREGGGEGGRRWAKRRNMGPSVRVSIIKVK